MRPTLIPLLIVGTSVPREARRALWMAERAVDEPARMRAKETAVHVLLRELDLTCEEVRELVDLPLAWSCPGL
jgi:hypothetical protein